MPKTARMPSRLRYMAPGERGRASYRRGPRDVLGGADQGVVARVAPARVPDRAAARKSSEERQRVIVVGHPRAEGAVPERLVELVAEVAPRRRVRRDVVGEGGLPRLDDRVPDRPLAAREEEREEAVLREQRLRPVERLRRLRVGLRGHEPR